MGPAWRCSPAINDPLTIIVRAKFRLSFHHSRAWSAVQASLLRRFACDGRDAEGDRPDPLHSGRTVSPALVFNRVWRGASLVGAPFQSLLMHHGPTGNDAGQFHNTLAADRTPDIGRVRNGSQTPAACVAIGRWLRASRRRKRQSPAAANREAVVSLRARMRIDVFRLCARSGVSTVKARTPQCRGGIAGKFCGTNVSPRACPACAPACARLRLRMVQSQDRGPRPVGAAEGRIRAKMLSKCRKNRSRTAAAAAGIPHLRGRFRTAITGPTTAVRPCRMASIPSGKSFFRLTGSTLSTGNDVSVVYEFSTVIGGGNFDGDRAARARR